jgi:hypothetical protein
MALEMGFRAAEFLVSEANGFRAREVGTVVGGTAPGLPAGQVLGRLANGNYVAYDAGAETGAEDISGILYDGQIGTCPQTVVVRDAEVNYKHLTVTGTKAVIVAGLNALGIAVREE